MLHGSARASAVIALAATLVGSGSSLRAALAAEDLDPLQVIADVTVIDAECRANNAMFGAVFRYGESRGVRTVDIMPLGRRRAEFEAAFNRRLASTPREEICGSLQAEYSHVFPDWFSARSE